MELIFYDVTPNQHGLPLNTNVFNCHICKHRHSSYPEVEAHYLTQHTNVIIVLKEGEKTSIRRHFVGPKSRRPNYCVGRVNRAKAKRPKVEIPLPIRASLPHFPQDSPLLAPQLVPLEEEVEDDDLTLTAGWEFDNLMMPEPSEDILGLFNCPELASEFNITADVPAIELSQSEKADIPDERINSSARELQKEQLGGPEPTLTVDLDEIELTLLRPTQRKFDPDVNQAKTDMTPLTPDEQNIVLEMDEIELTLVTPTKRNLQLGAPDPDRIDDPLTPTKGKLEALQAIMYELSPLIEFKLNMAVGKDDESGEVDPELNEALEFALRLEDEATNAADIRELDLLEHSR